MTTKELLKNLIDGNIPDDAYSLAGGLPNEKLCLNSNLNYWEVYYSERGIKTGLQIFNSESEACDYFYSLILTIY